jgi:hypothetical protein
MKTAMQELIEWCNSCLTDKTMSKGGRIALEVTILRASDLLEKEKEQIIDAYYGNIDGVFGYREEGQEYYKQDFTKSEQKEDIIKADEDDVFYKMSEEEIRDWHMIQSLKEKYGE